MVSRAKHSAGQVDAFRLARERGVAAGDVDPHRLPRVADLLADGPASITWRIEGGTDATARPSLAVDLTGAVTLTCQRCLADFEWPIDQHTDVLLARDEREVAALDAGSGAEVVLAEGPVNPLTLVEDELVLALPFAPRHPEGGCPGT